MTVEKFLHRKSLSQNFLVNRRILERIIDVCCLKDDETVLEIGPGQGALTWEIAKRVKKLIVIEKDERLIKELEQIKEKASFDHVTIIQADILRYPFDNLPENLKVIGNLPYHIATPIIEKVIGIRNRCQDLYVMLQLEHGQRLMAKPHTKDYGSLSCFVQYYTQPKMLFKIPNTAFSPRPKIESCFLHLKLLLEPVLKANNEDILFKIIRQAFSQRRKMIQNSLESMISKNELAELFKRLNIDVKSRAEDIKLEDYVRIANDFIKSNLETNVGPISGD